MKTYCSGCNKDTLSKRIGRVNYICEECKHDKSLSDFLFYETLYGNKEEKK